MLNKFEYKNNKNKNKNNNNLTKYITPFRFKSHYNSIIPLKIFQTWHTKILPVNMLLNIQNLKKCHPNFQYYLYDDNDCREFIKNNYSNEVLWAFDKLIPGAYKADLWRYCILYTYGGVYLDIKFNSINNFRLIALTEKEHFVLDADNIGIYNGFMVCKPGNKILLDCINKIIEHVKIKYYGEGYLHPTGPRLLGSYFTIEEKGSLELKLEPVNEQHFINYNNMYILASYKEYRTEQKFSQKKEHYSNLWNNKQIYY
jgi:mannosyltransferase OCH1-like enzyme